MGHDRVARLVNRDGVSLALDVLHVLRRAQVLQLLGLDDVAPFDRVPSVADGVDQGLVHQVLDRGARRVGRDRGQLLDLLRGQAVLDLLEVADVGADAPGLGRVAHLVDAIEAAGPKERGVQDVRPVGGHHHEDPVLGRRLRPHPEGPSDDPVEEAAGLLQAGELGEEGLKGAHASASGHAAHDDAISQAAAGLVARARRQAALQDEPRGLGMQVGEPVACGLRGPGAEPGLPAGSQLAHHPPVPEGVGLVEEDDDAAVAQAEPAELPEQGLHLDDADTHEHVDECARVHENERPAGLSGDRLGHQRLSGPRWTPQQDSAWDVATLLLDLVRLL